MVLKAVIKALKKADRLKEQMQTSKDLLNDNEAWLSQQQLQRVYQQVLILDLEYALDKKIEQDLWNHGFKNFIVNLQSTAKDKKNPKHSESQAMLFWCLEAASGFYLSLLHEICSAFDLDLPFRRKGSIYGCNKNITSIDSHCQPNKSSCYYICQYCLVHLGDIARYRNQSRQAEAFYRYAVLLSPSSGQPYNQLAILEASRGDKLSTVYHYVRSVALRHPFPVAATNLSRTLDKHAEEIVKIEGHSKLSSYEYITAFLKLHGLLHTNTELDMAEKLIQILATSLTAHIATESLSSWKLVQMVTINIFALHHAGSSMDGKIRTFSNEELTSDEQKVKLLISDFLAACLSAFLLPVYTIKSGEPLLDYFALPAIKLTLEWIRQEPQVLQTTSFTNRLQIWPSLCKLLNDVQPTISEFSSDNYSHVPLPEDRDLQGFLPFEKCFQHLKFHTEDLKMDTTALNKLRVSRLVNFGIWLSGQLGQNIITATKTSNPSGSNNIVFEAMGRQEPPSGEQIRELEEMILTKLPSPTPSEGSGSITGASTPDSSNFFSSLLMNPILKFKSAEFSSQENLQEKRPGILKSQNSTEKIVEKTKNEKVAKPLIPSNRGQRNVALQAIMNKNSEESKQVTFKTPSPTQESNNNPSPKKTNLKTNASKPVEQKLTTGEVILGKGNMEDSKKEKKTGKHGKDWNHVKNKHKEGSDESQQVDITLLQQQKLMDVLVPRNSKKQAKQEPTDKKKDKSKETPFAELMSAFPPLPGVKEGLKGLNAWSPGPAKEVENESLKGTEEKNNQKNVNKQQLLSELFSKNKANETEQKQPQNMSGLLNLSKQQQQMLTDSKQVKSSSPHLQQQPPQPLQSSQQQLLTPQQQPQPQPQPQPQQQRSSFNRIDFPHLQTNAAVQKLKCVDQMEAARKEYEAAMIALQQKQEQEAQIRFQGMHEADMNQFEYDRRMNLQQPPPQQQTPPQVYLRMNQPLINVGFGFKYSPQLFVPWQEPEQPPMPPSWWSETPQNRPQQQPLPFNSKSGLEMDWSYQPYSVNFPSYVTPSLIAAAREDLRSYQMPENFAPQPPPPETMYQQAQQATLGMSGSSYSLFSTPSWNTVRTGGEAEPDPSYGLSGSIMNQQSFWSGPGPSPLERLLEQQKQMREAPTEPKSGT